MGENFKIENLKKKFLELDLRTWCMGKKGEILIILDHLAVTL